HIPEFIFTISDQHKYTFLSQFIDDEGTVNVAGKHVSLTSACLEKYGKSHLLEDIQRLLLPLDILCSIYPSKVYSSKRGEPRKTWKLQINGSIQLKKLYEYSNIRSQEKKERLYRLINSYSLTIFRRRDILETYINFMRKIQTIHGFFTSLDLANETGRAEGSCRNMIAKYQKLGIATCIQPLVLTSKGAVYGRYVLDPLI
ncbi:MAG: LAGLIDADG family homing endonuclease, partial [Nanoarchaeota archaeon]